MALRSTLRRRVVLPVTIVRHEREKQLAHTLDLTATSARLGGLVSPLEPGEMIEIERSGVKARFQVFWMGAPGSHMEGQAGVRIQDPRKSIWGPELARDEIDIAVDTERLRISKPPVRAYLPGTKSSTPKRNTVAEIAASTQHKNTGEPTGLSSAECGSAREKATMENLRLDSYPPRMLAMACKTLAEHCETWRSAYSISEITEFREAVASLEQTLLPSGPGAELPGYLAANTPALEISPM